MKNIWLNKSMIHKFPSFYIAPISQCWSWKTDSRTLWMWPHWSLRRLRSCHLSRVDIAKVTEGFHITFKIVDLSTLAENPFISPSLGAKQEDSALLVKVIVWPVLLESHHCPKSVDETKWVHREGRTLWLLTKALGTLRWISRTISRLRPLAATSFVLVNTEKGARVLQKLLPYIQKAYKEYLYLL